MKARNLYLLLMSLFISAAAFTQNDTTDKRDNLLFLLRQPEHITQALNTIEQLQSNSNSTLSPGKIMIIVCGETVTRLNTPEAERWANRVGKYSEVSIVACGLSLAKFKKSEKDLARGIGYVENGFIKTFELQEEGYLSVEL